MKKIIVSDELVNGIAETEIVGVHISKASREIKKQRLAKAMTQAFIACGL